MEMEQISGTFPYVNRNPEFWWKPFLNTQIKKNFTEWKGGGGTFASSNYLTMIYINKHYNLIEIFWTTAVSTC